jgi:hypothetical protein
MLFIHLIFCQKEFLNNPLFHFPKNYYSSIPIVTCALVPLAALPNWRASLQWQAGLSELTCK